MISVSRLLFASVLLISGAAFAVAQQPPGKNTKDPAGSETAKPTGGKSTSAKKPAKKKKMEKN